MESNRDEAERCIEIAAQAFRDSKMEKAEKFLKKADQLFPSQKAKGKIRNKKLIVRATNCGNFIFFINRFTAKSIEQSKRQYD